MRKFLLKSGLKMSFARGATLTLLLIFLTGFSYGASLLGDQTKNFVIKNKPLQQAIEQILDKSGYYVVYAVDNIKSLGNVSVEYNSITTEEALKNVLSGKGLSFTIKDNNVIITKAETVSQQPKSILVKGRVMEKGSKRAIAGATIIVEGTTKGAITDEKGQFTFTCNIGDVMEVTFMGMKSQKVTVSAATTDYTILLEQDAVAMDDVIVTGIFNKAKESYTGAVSTVTAKDLKMYRGQNLISTLKNIDPSLNIVVNNKLGSNPNTLPEVNIRGNSSLPMSVKELNEGTKQQLNTPLIIMDGFEVSLQKLMDFNDEEVESINILKDASATAIYGSRGANGVIVVTTKAPQAGKLRIFVQAGINIEIPDLSSYNLLKAKDKLDLEYRVGLYDNDKDPNADIKLKQLYNNKLTEVLNGVETDWLAQPLRTGVGQKYNLRIEGGSQEFRWSTSLSYNKTQGAMKGSERDNFSGTMTLSYAVKNVIFKNQLTVDINKGSESNYGPFNTYAAMNPYLRTHDDHGALIESYDPFFDGGTRINNPMKDAELNVFDQNKYNALINNFSIEWNIIESLKLRAQIGLSRNTNSLDKYYPAGHSYFNKREYEGDDNFFRQGRYEYRTGEKFDYDGNITLSYSKTFAEKHQLYVGLDYSISQGDEYYYDFITEGFTNNNLDFLGNALQYGKGTKPSGKEDISRRIGFTGNLNYTYNNRYFVDLSYRIDGSSQFGTENKFAPFWSAGLGWNIHRENFLKNNNTITNFRLRGSFGQTGSQQFEAYQALSTFEYYQSSRYMIWNGAQLKGLGNENLKWQMTEQFNGGVELGLWNNRLAATFDIYTKKTSNLLSQMDTPLATGFESYVDNVGKVKNTGYEAGLSGYLIRDTQREIIWMVSAKIAYNKNRITELSQAIIAQNEIYKAQDVEVNRLLYEGYSQNSIYAVPSLGIDPSTGQEMYLDKNNVISKTWRASDKRYIGVAEPKYRGNINTMFTYKNLTLNLSFGYNWGGQQYNETLINKVEVTRDDIRQNVDARVLTDRWMKPGDVKFFRKIDDRETKMTSRFVMDDNVFELQSASLQYKWAADYLKESMRVESINFGVNMSDVFHISSIKRERGTEYPFARRVSFTISLMF